MTKLEEYMKENNLTKKQLSKMCGVSVYLLNKLCDGKRNVSSDTLFKISVATKIRVDDLLGR